MSGKATLMPEVRGECRTTAAHSNRDAKSTVGTVPMLCPYRMIFSGLMPYLKHKYSYFTIDYSNKGHFGDGCSRACCLIIALGR